MEGYIAQGGSSRSARITVLRYTVAIGTVVSGVVLALWLRPVLDASVLLLLAIWIAAWFCGLWPALLAAGLATLALVYFFVPPFHTFAVQLTYLPHTIAFLLLAALIASAAAARRTAERALKQSRDEMETSVRERTADLRAANQRLSTQYAVTRVLAESDSLEQAAPRLLETIGTTMDWDYGALWKVDRDAGVLRCESIWHAPELDSRDFAAIQNVTFTAGRGLPGRVWQTGAPHWIAEVTDDSSFVRLASAAQLGLRGAIAFPILLREDTVAVAEFFSRAVRAADREQLDMLSALGSQIGQFIERKRVEEERERLFAREQAAHAEAVGAQHRFVDLVNSIDGIVWEADARSFQFAFVSKQAERILGYPVEEWLTRPGFWKDHIHPDDRDWAVDFSTRATAEQHHDFEYRMIAANGRTVWLRDLVSVVADGRAPTRRGVMFDISERKTAEKALREQADLLNLTHDTVFVRDRNDVITYWNRGAEELYGWTREEALNKVTHDLMKTVFPAPLEQIREQLLRTGRWEGELLHTRRDGSQVVVASRWSLQRDADGLPLAILETNNDVTQRKQAEEALRDSREQWQAVFENNPTMYFIVDSQGTILSVNPFGAEQLGYTTDELIGQSVLTVFPAEERDSARRSVEQCLERLGHVRSWEIRKVRKNGIVIWVRETAKAMRRAARDPIVLIACEDITARKRAEAELRESERRHRHIFHATGASIWEEDFSQVKAAIDRLKASGVRDFGDYFRRCPEFIDEAISLVRVVDVNDATLKLLDAGTKEELLGSLHKVFTAETREVFAGELVAMAEGRSSFEGESILQTVKGQRVAVLFSLSFPPPDSAFDAVLVSIMDITDRKRAEQELEDLAGRLIHAQEQERSRIGRELHDHISQTLGVLTIKIDQLHADPATPPMLARALHDLRQNTAEITDDVHRLSHRLHSSTLDYLGLGPALQKLVKEFSERYDISIQFTHASLPPALPSDVALCLFRVTEESLTNIAKHSRAPSARVRVTGGSEGIDLSIEDDGHGFEVTSLETRAGLGFVSMRERLRVLKGTLRVDSAKARGTTIRAWVPLARIAADGIAEPAPGGASTRQAPPSVSSA